MYKMPKNNEEQKKCISGKTWVGKDSKGKERILIEDNEWNEKCMRAFVKRSKDFCEPMDDEDRLSKRIKNSANNEFTACVRKTALTHILKATRNALVVEKNAEFHCKFSTTSDRFKTEYKKAFERNHYASTVRLTSSQIVDLDCRRDILWLQFAQKIRAWRCVFPPFFERRRLEKTKNEGCRAERWKIFLFAASTEKIVRHSRK